MLGKKLYRFFSLRRFIELKILSHEIYKAYNFKPWEESHHFKNEKNVGYMDARVLSKLQSNVLLRFSHKNHLQRGRQSTRVAFALPTQPSRVRFLAPLSQRSTILQR